MKLFKRYLLYSVSVCCIFLTINIVNFFVSEDPTLGCLGYGGGRCYITKADMVLYTFVIPVAFFYTHKYPFVLSCYFPNGNITIN